MAGSTQLDLLYEINRRLATFGDLQEMLDFTIERTRELFEAEGCAVLLLDRKRRELYFPVTSTGEETTAREQLAATRFPANQGIAGWVLTNDESALVTNAQTDPRFYRGVDQQTGLKTRSLLCAPLRSGGESIGVIEVVNPGSREPTPDDLRFLEALASDIAVAYEKARLYDNVRGEAVGLRQMCNTIGAGLLGLSALLIGGSMLGHLAWGLPLRELALNPTMVAGVLAVAVGVLLVLVGRGRLVAPAEE